MGKKFLFLAILAVLVLAIAGVAHAWQGRMGGMEDPFGLVADESDYLIHPAKIANGEGVRFYGDYRFTYTGVMDWDYNVNVFDSSGLFVRSFRYNTTGYEQDHDVLLGSAFPLGPGRMGLFFNYQGKRSDYDGNVQPSFSSLADTYDLVSKFDAFAMRLFYGLPVEGVPVVGRVKLGGEFQFAYRQEKNETDLLQQSVFPAGISLENPQGSFSVRFFSGNKNFLLFMLPYDSHYLETLFKGSIETTIGPVAAALTVRGGFLFNGDNELVRIGTLNTFDLKGDVEGWRIGGDLWLRYPLAKDLTVPFLVRIDYQTKTRDGDGLPIGTLVGSPADYKSTEKSFDLEVGGGLDKEFAKGLRLAAGIYYGYGNARNEFSLAVPADSLFADYSPYPSLIEHRLRVALAGEWGISPAVTLRMGLEPFYGWIHEHFENASNEPFQFEEDVSLNGSRWGIGASVGGSVKLLQKLTLEPFVNGGYQEIKLDGNGIEFLRSAFLDVSELQRQWYIGGGFSILYDL